MTKRLRQMMLAARYHEFREGWEAAEFTYTPLHWQQAHRFVAVRRPVAYEPEAQQRYLFTFKRYTYHRVLVTNLHLTLEAIYRFYCDRAFPELLLREFKHAYQLAAIPTKSFWVNAAYLELILWAYDLVRAFPAAGSARAGAALEHQHPTPRALVAARRVGPAGLIATTSEFQPGTHIPTCWTGFNVRLPGSNRSFELICKRCAPLSGRELMHRGRL